ncbi:MAG: hypothetical protein GWP10_18110 [Nitrospiraceae bacterium]|nr:hypothetical protein [Nitrospiraceae bacterium]
MSAPQPNSGNNIEQIRELIFGESMREYERRFIELQKRVEKNQARFEETVQELRQQIETVNGKGKESLNGLKKELDEAARGIHQELETMKAELLDKIQQLALDKTDRLQLANFLTELALRLKGEDVLQQLASQVESSEK